VDLVTTLVVLVATVLATTAICSRLDVSPPLALILVGIVGSYLPFVPEVHLEDSVAELAPGDALVLDTDGVTEARRDRPLTPQALAEVLAPRYADSARRLAREVVRLAEEGAAGPLRDDLAVLVVALRKR